MDAKEPSTEHRLQSGLQRQARSALRPRLSAATVSGPDMEPRQQMGARARRRRAQKSAQNAGEKPEYARNPNGVPPARQRVSHLNGAAALLSPAAAEPGRRMWRASMWS